MRSFLIFVNLCLLSVTGLFAIELPLDELDGNLDGKLSFLEFSANRNVRNVPAGTLLKLFKRLDRNGDDLLELEETEKGKLFNVWNPPHDLDENMDGMLSFFEFSSSESVQNVPAGKLINLFERLDKNQDNFLDQVELNKKKERPELRFFMPSKKMVKQLDINSDSQVSFDEYVSQRPMASWSETQKKRVFSFLDKNGDNVVSLQEFSEGRRANEESHQIEMDVDGDGNVTIEEFRSSEVIRDLPEKRRRRFFKHMDKNQDGILNRLDLELLSP